MSEVAMKCFEHTSPINRPCFLHHSERALAVAGSFDSGVIQKLSSCAPHSEQKTTPSFRLLENNHFDSKIFLDASSLTA